MTTSARRARRILVLYRHDPGVGMLAAVHAHLHALDGQGHEVVYVNTLDGVPESLRLLSWDAVVLHTTILTMRWHVEFYVWKWTLRWLSELRCIKIAIPQDEYDHAHVLDEWLYELGVDVVYTNFDEARRRHLYPILDGRAEFEECLTGYVDGRSLLGLRPTPIGDRPLDLVYRARRLPYHFGSHGQLKHVVGVEAAAAAVRLRLRADVSTNPADTLTGRAWIHFLASGRATVGAESGSSVLDRRGEVRSAVERLLRTDPALSFDEVSSRLPAGWDDYSFAAIGPRHLEAVVTRTPQLLVEGGYDGVLEPERHYLPIAHDLHDLEATLERAQDTALMQRLADTAYADIVESGRYSYESFAERVLRRIETGPPLRLRTLERPLRKGAARLDDVGRRVGWTIARVRGPAVLRPGGGAVAREHLRRGRRIVLAAGATARLLARTPEARRLFVDAYRSGIFPRPHAIARELLHLNTIRKLELGEDSFSVESRLSGHTLDFIARARIGERTGGARQALAAVNAGTVRSIAWHPPAGGDVVQLRELALLARYCPRSTARVLEHFVAPT
jgi:hypothetical protein